MKLSITIIKLINVRQVNIVMLLLKWYGNQLQVLVVILHLAHRIQAYVRTGLWYAIMDLEEIYQDNVLIDMMYICVCLYVSF